MKPMRVSCLGVLVMDALSKPLSSYPIPVERPQVVTDRNASLNVFYYEQDGDWSLGTWGDVAHLTSLGTLDDT